MDTLTSAEEYDLLILGCGTGGKVLAGTFAQKGQRVIVVERKYVAGSCPNIACLPSKNIIHSAKVASFLNRSEEFGISKENVHINMAAVRDRKRKMVATVGRQVPFCMFTDPELARIGLSETEAKQRGISYRVAKLPMASVLRAMTISETRGFMKVLIETESDRILGFTMFGVGAGDVMAVVQMAMLGGLPYTAVRDTVIAHPTMPEGLILLFGKVPPVSRQTTR